MTSIEWTDKTWNPIVGCSIVSPGCTNCYAMTMAARIEAINANQVRSGLSPTHYAGTAKKVNGKAVWTGNVARAAEYILLAPLHRRKPTMYFVNSMGDLFHEDIPDEWIDRVFAVMALCPQHIFQVLTKRAERMRNYLSDRTTHIRVYAQTLLIAAGRDALRDDGSWWPLPNVWLGVSCERQQEADERIPLLLQTPAAIRFISAEPLIGPIYNLRRMKLGGGWYDVLAGWRDVKERFPGFDNTLDWVIVGGESGSRARPMHPDWARKIRDDCAAAGVPFFFKQWGEFTPGDLNADVLTVRGEITNFLGKLWAGRGSDGSYPMNRVGKKRAGRKLDGKEHNEFPKAKAGEARAA